MKTEMKKSMALFSGSVNPELAEQIAEAVNAQVVQVVGRNFVLFRPNEKDSRITLPRA